MTHLIRGSGRRLVLTAWLLTAAGATTNVVRETYLAVALAERGTIRVDPYLGLNSDLFELPGRGAFINGNPGTSFLAAIPYAAARPLLERLYRARPALVSPKPPATYDDARPNRTAYMNAMRERGLDIRLALAAIVMQIGLMAPLAALAALVLWRFLVARGGGERPALALALLYALGTPVLFRSAYLNQNVLLAHAVLFAWTLLRWPGEQEESARLRRWAGAGLLLGAGVLLDYSAMPLALVFAAWGAREGWRRRGAPGAAARLAAMALGALSPVAFLLAYQRAAFGSFFLPAQSYMPATPLSVHGWYGMTPPSPDLLWRHLADPDYGLFVFCPLLLLSFVVFRHRGAPGAPEGEEIGFALAAVVALWLFESANQYARMQFNSGVRYLLPAVPLLFLLAVPALLALRRPALWAWVAPTLVVSAAVVMTRESVPRALVLLVTEGPALPLLRTLRKTSGAYAPFLARGLQPWGALSVLAVAALLAFLWRGARGPRDA